MTEIVDEMAYPLLLAAHGVPPWLRKIGFGHSEMYWYHVVERWDGAAWWGPPSATKPDHLNLPESRKVIEPSCGPLRRMT